MTENQPGNKTWVEKLTVGGENLVDVIKDIFDKPNVEKITVRDKDGKQLLSVPAAGAAVGLGAGVLLAPILTIAGAIGGALAELTLEVEHRQPPEVDGAGSA